MQETPSHKLDSSVDDVTTEILSLNNNPSRNLEALIIELQTIKEREC